MVLVTIDKLLEYVGLVTTRWVGYVTTLLGRVQLNLCLCVCFLSRTKLLRSVPPIFDKVEVRTRFKVNVSLFYPFYNQFDVCLESPSCRNTQLCPSFNDLADALRF